MDTQLVDPQYRPNQFLVLLEQAGQPKFIGFATEAEAKKAVTDNPGRSVFIEYMLSASFGNSRHQTLAEAMQSKFKYQPRGGCNIGIQPVLPPDNLPKVLADAYWQAPRETDFPDFKVE